MLEKEYRVIKGEKVEGESGVRLEIGKRWKNDEKVEREVDEKVEWEYRLRMQRLK